MLTFAGSDDRITMLNTLGTGSADIIERISFDDGTVWTMADVNTLLSNHIPIAVSDSYFTALQDANTVITAASLLRNDHDADGDPLHIVALTAPDHGTVQLDAGGNVVFFAGHEFTGLTRFRYTVSDGRNGLAEAEAYVRIDPQPSARADAGLSTAEDTQITISAARLLANDLDGDLLTLSSVGQAVNGEVFLATGGNIVFKPTADFNGKASFVYTASLPQGGEASAKVSIDVTAVNDPPVAVADAGFITAEGQALILSAAGLVGNDRDVDRDVLRLDSVSSAVGGEAVLNADGSVLFTPTRYFFGDASFIYTVTDGHGGTSRTTASITVTPVNDLPVAGNDVGFICAEDQGITLAAADLLANDGDPDGDPLAITGVLHATHGTVELRPNATVRFDPAKDYHGPAGFDYQVSDGQGGVTLAHVDLTVTPVNDAPLVQDEIFEGTLPGIEDEGLRVDPATLLANDSDPDGDPLTILSVSDGVHGSVGFEADGTILFTPDANYFGAASFKYLVSDSHGDGGGAVGTASIDIAAVRDGPPVAGNDNAATLEDTPLVIHAADLLANDTDIDNNPLSIVAVHPHRLGDTVWIEDNGDIVFTPNKDYFGTTSFDYVVSDGRDGTDTGRVAVAVAPVNDVPVAVADAGSTTLDVPFTLHVSDLIANDTDVENNTLTLDSIGNASVGTVSVRDGTWAVLQVPAGFSGLVSFEYLVSDGQGGSTTGAVTVAVANETATVITGTARNDLLLGSDHDETLVGLESSDLIDAGGGDDTLRGGEGADRLDGGDGFDTADYSDSAIGVRADLNARVGQGGTAEADVYLNIEGVSGSTWSDQLYGDAGTNALKGNAGADTLDGRAGDDLLDGGSGDDVLIGGTGADSLLGGDGTDTADYGQSGEGVRVSLATGLGAGGDAEGDTLAGIEDLTGSQFADNLEGNDGANRLLGGRGDDSLLSGRGDDILIGGKGDDTLSGESGSDTYAILRGDGDDVVLDAGNAGDIDALVLGAETLGLAKELPPGRYPRLSPGITNHGHR
ncbi:hypothetical protein WCLP8_4910001 [uncultured Gammaproteobacteria bacterium]